MITVQVYRHGYRLYVYEPIHMYAKQKWPGCKKVQGQSEALGNRLCNYKIPNIS